MQSILNGISLGAAHRVEGHDPTVVEGDSDLEEEVCVATGQVLVEMQLMDWAKTQREDPVLNAVLGWLEAQKKTDLKTLLGEHASSVDSPTGMEESPEFCDPPKNPLPMHNTQEGE